MQEFVRSRQAKSILKCSLAYFLATLAVFIPSFTKVLGSSDGKHLVANIVIWYNPARSSGSIDQGIIYALIAFLFAAFVAYTSMLTATAFDHANLLSPWGHVVILIVFCGGSLGAMSWTRQRVSDFLISVSVSLASIPIVTVLTKDPAIHEGFVSHTVISQTLKMAVMAILISTVVTVVVWPIRARIDLRENLVKATNAFSDVLSSTATAFLTGNKEDMGDVDKMTSSMAGLSSNLKEARNEHYFLGAERQYHIEERLVECVQELAQDIGGLRSAASTQFDLLDQCVHVSSIRAPTPATSALKAQSIAAANSNTQSQASQVASPNANATNNDNIPRPTTQTAAGIVGPAFGSPASSDSFKSIITVLERGHGQSDEASSDRGSVTDDRIPTSPDSTGRLPHEDSLSAETSADIFNTFVEQLGPHMKSLAYTLREILRELPFGPGPKFEIKNNPHFKPSLKDAVKLFAENRKQALRVVYRSKAITLARSSHVAVDFEEVAASCGHFSTSLQDLAENVVKYLDILDELEEEITERTHGRSWWWAAFWRRQTRPTDPNRTQLSGQRAVFDSRMSAWFRHADDLFLKLLHRPVQSTELPKNENAINTNSDFTETVPAYAASFQSTFRYKLWKSLRMFRRDDIRFAIKVGAGGALLAAGAYYPSTQPYFFAWRLEWSLATYMFVCSMTIGGANTMVFARLLGTSMGATLAIIVWLLGDDNPFVLVFLGWMVSLICFYVIIVKNQGPMGRFMLLTYNLSVLYSYSLSVNDQDRDEDEGGVNPAIFNIVKHRLIAIVIGILYGLIVTRAVWPISARRKLKSGLSLIWLRMGLIWKRGPLTVMQAHGEDHDLALQPTPSYMEIKEELKLRGFAGILDAMRKNAESEFTLRRPFQTKTYDNILKSTGRMLDAFHALNVIVSKDLKATPGEVELLRYTLKEREQLARRISHLLSGKYPLPARRDVNPDPRQCLRLRSSSSIP